MSFVPLAITAAVAYHLFRQGTTSRTAWLVLNTLDTYRALRLVRPNGRRVGSLTRRRAMREALMCWFVYIAVQAVGSLPDRLLGWLPLYSVLRSVLMVTFILTRITVSQNIYTSLLRPLLRKYETSLDLTILLVRSLIILIYHYAVQLPLETILQSARTLGPALARVVLGWIIAAHVNGPHDPGAHPVQDPQNTAQADDGDMDVIELSEDELPIKASTLVSETARARKRQTPTSNRPSSSISHTNPKAEASVTPGTVKNRIQRFEMEVIDLTDLPGVDDAVLDSHSGPPSVTLLSPPPPERNATLRRSPRRPSPAPGAMGHLPDVPLTQPKFSKIEDTSNQVHAHRVPADDFSTLVDKPAPIAGPSRKARAPAPILRVPNIPSSALPTSGDAKMVEKATKMGDTEQSETVDLGLNRTIAGPSRSRLSSKPSSSQPAGTRTSRSKPQPSVTLGAAIDKHQGGVKSATRKTASTSVFRGEEIVAKARPGRRSAIMVTELEQGANPKVGSAAERSRLSRLQARATQADPQTKSAVVQMASGRVAKTGEKRRAEFVVGEDDMRKQVKRAKTNSTSDL